MQCISNFHTVFITCNHFSIALGNLTIDYIFQQEPHNAARNASIVINITCNWGMFIDSVVITPEEVGQRESCSSTSSFQFKTVVLTCTNLNDDTFYDTSIEAMVQLDNETYPLQFSISFHTESNGFLLSSKYCNYSLNNFLTRPIIWNLFVVFFHNTWTHTHLKLVIEVVCQIPREHPSRWWLNTGL